jgi:hypothetical protein
MVKESTYDGIRCTRARGFDGDQTTVKSLGTTEAMAGERKGTRDRGKPRSEAVEVTEASLILTCGFRGSPLR